MKSRTEEEQAARSLDQIEEAQARGKAVSAYRDAAPRFVLWGAAWLIANSAMEVSVLAGLVAWPVVGGIAIFASNLMARRLRARRRAFAPETLAERKIDWRVGASFSLLFVFVVLVGFIFSPVSYRALSAFISLIAAFAYMTAGLWLGGRLFVIGALVAMLILAGYFGLKDYYFIWLGVVGGCALIAGGLWLRTA